MDRRDFYYRQTVTEAELDAAFNAAELSDYQGFTDLGMTGILTGSQVVEATVPNLTVDVVAGVSRVATGERAAILSLQNLDLSVDSSGAATAVAGAPNSKILSVFVKFNRSDSDPRTDGNGSTVFFVRNESFSLIVRQGAEAVTPAAPALESDGVLLADVTIVFGQTAIVDANIDMTDRRQDAFQGITGALTLRTGTPNDAIVAVMQHLADHIAGASNEHAAAAIDYAGGDNWANGNANPATDVEQQIDKVIFNLSGTVAPASGSDHLGAGLISDSPVSLAAGTLISQLTTLLTGVNARAQLATDETITGQWKYDDVIEFDGGATDEIVKDLRAAPSDFMPLFELPLVSTRKIRVYAYGSNVESSGGIVITFNFGLVSGQLFDRDTADPMAAIFLRGAGILIKNYSGAGSINITSGEDTLTEYKAPSTSDHTVGGSGGGVIINDDQIEVMAGDALHAASASDNLGCAVTFPKLFPSAPSSATENTVHTATNVGARSSSNLNTYGMMVRCQATAGGSAIFTSSWLVS